MFTLKIETDNAAFGESRYEAKQEVARILRDLIAKLEADGETIGQLRDVNGNRVGEWQIKGT